MRWYTGEPKWKRFFRCSSLPFSIVTFRWNVMESSRFMWMLGRDVWVGYYKRLYVFVWIPNLAVPNFTRNKCRSLLLSERPFWVLQDSGRSFFLPHSGQLKSVLQRSFLRTFCLPETTHWMLIISTPNMLWLGFLPVISMKPYIQQYGNGGIALCGN